MIRWRQTHSAFFTAGALSASILAFYLALVLPVTVSNWIGAVLYFLPGVFITAVFDHGLTGAPWSLRIRRFLLSAVFVFSWLVVALGSASYFNSGEIGLGATFADTWSAAWPLSIMALVVAVIGVAIVRWIERWPAPRGVAGKRV